MALYRPLRLDGSDDPNFEYPAPINPNADGLGAFGFYPQSLTGFDATVGIERDASNNLILRDPTASVRTLSQLVYRVMVVERAAADLSTGYGGQRFLKTHSVFLASPAFVKVFEVLGGVATELAFNTAWTWNTGAGGDGSKLGGVPDLTDGVRIITVTAGRSYRLVVYETDMLTTPTVIKWRADRAPTKRRGIPPRQSRDGAAPVLLTSIVPTDDFTYTARYGTPTSITDVFNFADTVGVSHWSEGASLPPNVRIELYHFGRLRSSKRQRVDSTIIPAATYTTNAMSLRLSPFVTSRYVTGIWMVRVRDISTNAVSPWALQRICTRQYGVWNPGYTALVGKYKRALLSG